MDEHVERAAKQVIGAAIEVHRALGPGYGEDVYEEALAIELEHRGIPFEKQCPFNLTYRGQPIGKGKIDLLVDNCLVVELKAVQLIGEVHVAQAISYLKATRHHLALIINFNVPRLVDGVRRVVL